MKYHLWDTGAGSYIGQYDDERDALAAARVLIDGYGPGFASELSLGRVHDDGTILEPLSGNALIARLRLSTAGGATWVGVQATPVIGQEPQFLGASARVSYADNEISGPAVASSSRKVPAVNNNRIEQPPPIGVP